MKKTITEKYARRAVNAGKLKIYGTCVDGSAYVILQDNLRQRTLHAAISDDAARCIEYTLAGCPGYGPGTSRVCLVTWPTWSNAH
jgi:hypothetical protein